MTYDEAGYVTVDGRFLMRRFDYDANGRQTKSSNLDGTGAVTSVFDGAGRRVAAKANGQLTAVMVYDAAGDLVAEFGGGASGGGRRYVMEDRQGSARVVSDAAGAVASRRDYLPFGAEVGAGVGLRTSAQGYRQPSPARRGYAGMERDDEAGTGHTLWREYDDSSGRWTAPDPYGASLELGDPQTFNRYSYVANDPVNQIDPLGLMRYDFKSEEAQILYSQDPCTAGLEGMWNVPRDMVVSILVRPKGGLRLSDLGLDLSKYKVVRDTQRTIYGNYEEGIRYHVLEAEGEPLGEVLEVYYEPTLADRRRLICPGAARQPAESECSRDNQTDSNPPRAGTCPEIQIREPSGEPCRAPSRTFSAVISGLDPNSEPTYKWGVSGGIIVSGQGRDSIEVVVIEADGGPFAITLKVEGLPKYCPSGDTYRPVECPKR